MKPALQPYGVGDLKVVKTRLARYEGGEVAHIENVLASEERSRKHRRLRQTEEIVTVEEERIEENTRDLQTTERFELQTESDRTIKSETSLSAGLNLSASYGPVSLSAYAGFSSNESKEQADRNATAYAKEITDRTLSRLIERVSVERRTRTLDEVEESNSHGFNNANGDNITGVYRWVDKLYRAKVVNYGKRLLYEFIVPEPAAYYLWASRRHQAGELPAKPSTPLSPGGTDPLTPASINRTTYLALAQQYGAEGIEPPPPDAVVVAKAIARELQPNRFWAFANEDLEIPRGYRAVRGNFRWSGSWADEGSSAVLIVGQNWINLLTDRPTLTFAALTGKIGMSLIGLNVFHIALNVEVLCELIPEHFAQWQLAMYRAVMAAYRQQLMEYEERMAALEIQQAGRVGGENPLTNRETEREQLKWLCLALWADVPFGSPPSIVPAAGTAGPRPHRPNAVTNTPKIEFFEEAFEWRNLTYELYPYFWGNDETREDRLSFESGDPLFERFLRAGAARVTLPVRPSRTDAVLWYQLTGAVWSGGPVPALTATGQPEATLYNSYLEEMEDIADIEEIEAEIAIAANDPDAWPIRVPTSLVWLQETGDLPDFENP